VDEIRITPAGDPFHAAAPDQDHPHACMSGYVYLGYIDEDGEEHYEAVRCRWCGGRDDKATENNLQDI
jgi:hypothetical protein